MSLCPYKKCINYGRYCRRLHTEEEMKSKEKTTAPVSEITTIKTPKPKPPAKDFGDPKNWDSNNVYPPKQKDEYLQNIPAQIPVPIGRKIKPPIVKKKPSNHVAKSKKRS